MMKQQYHTEELPMQLPSVDFDQGIKNWMVHRLRPSVASIGSRFILKMNSKFYSANFIS